MKSAKEIKKYVENLLSTQDKIDEKLTGFKTDELFKTDFGLNLGKTKEFERIILSKNHDALYKFANTPDGNKFINWLITVIGNRELSNKISKLNKIAQGLSEVDKNLLKDSLDEFIKKHKSQFKKRIKAIKTDESTLKMFKVPHLSEKSETKRKELTNMKKVLNKNSEDAYKVLKKSASKSKKILDNKDDILNHERNKLGLLNNIQRKIGAIRGLTKPRHINESNLNALKDLKKELLGFYEKKIQENNEQIKKIDENLKLKEEIKQEMGFFDSKKERKEETQLEKAEEELDKAA